MERKDGYVLLKDLWSTEADASRLVGLKLQTVRLYILYTYNTSTSTTEESVYDVNYNYSNTIIAKYFCNTLAGSDIP